MFLIKMRFRHNGENLVQRHVSFEQTSMIFFLTLISQIESQEFFIFQHNRLMVNITYTVQTPNQTIHMSFERAHRVESNGTKIFVGTQFWTEIQFPEIRKREGGVSSILGNYFLGEKNSKIQIIAYSN